MKKSPESGEAGGSVRRRIGWASKLALGAGVVVLAAAALWTPIAVPALVKFPTNTNLHLVYKGSLVTYLNAKTGAALKAPVVTTLTVDRHLQALPAESSSSVALVKETLAIRAGALKLTEYNVYAFNRRTMQAVTDPRAFTFVPGNVPGRYGSYYVTLPMGLSKSTSLPIWKPESASTYLLHPLAGMSSATPSTLDGLGVMWFSGTLAMTPAAPYERAALTSRGFPTSLTPAEVTALLAARGVSVKKLGTALAPVLTHSQTLTLLSVLSKPVPLQYYIFGSGLLAAEPRTGTIVELRNIVDGVAVRTDPAPLRTVISILDQHLSVPGVRAAVTAMSRIGSAPPAPVYQLRYTETPASIAATVTVAKSQISKITVATLYVPIGLGVLGLILVCPAIVGYIRRPRPGAEAGSGAVEAGAGETPSLGQTKAA